MTSDTFRVWKRVCCFFLSATSNATLEVALSCLIIRKCHRECLFAFDCGEPLVVELIYLIDSSLLIISAFQDGGGS